ncbi:hypothetical protein AcV5_004897 [Taiwanofungus camphoratus]|nr:hypothetical protein AcV5_004897 [Antrodia cinnamomea]
MPPKYASKERSWGTRYDSLDSSPPSSPPLQYPPTSTSIPHSPVTSVVMSSDEKDKTDEGKTLTHTNAVVKSEKMPHDASVFVGSLPTNVDHAELTYLLHEHLSEHAEVKNVKVVRDSRGGICAFVQCEDAAAAARLIRTLQSLPPRPFLGRVLRYEPARAFRTLLISYRLPGRILPSTGSNEYLDINQNQNIDSEPPNAMRIYRPQNAKYPTILYNSEARDFDITSVRLDDESDSQDAFSGAGLLFHPLKFDAETVRQLTSAFGPVEHIAPYVPPTDGPPSDKEVVAVIRPCPQPRESRRSFDMDPNIWEVKWCHRDDCVSALMTLRRMPYLIVTWAHHVPSFGHGPDLPNSYSTPLLGSRSSSYVPHMTMQSQPHIGTGGDYQRPRETRVFASRSHESTIPAHSRTSTAPPPNDSTLSPDAWTFAHSTPFLQGPPSPFATRSFRHQGTPHSGGHTKSPNWSENDFPPLGNMHLEENVNLTGKKDTRPWGDRDMQEGLEDLEEESSVSESPSSLSVNPSTTPAGAPFQSQLTNKRRLTQSLTTSPIQSHREQGDGQNLVAPPTPEFSLSPITPLTPKTGRDFPQTPTSPSGAAVGQLSHHGDTSYKNLGQFTTPRSGAKYEDGNDTGRPEDANRELDPTTIFVGGLEMYGANAWDEAKLQSVFGKFGAIEEIQLVRPLNKRSAFAFIKFADTDASIQAVSEEHNRIYHGRQIRVQLRDNNPPQRSPWRYSRGRGRILHPVDRSHDGDRSEGVHPDISAHALTETSPDPGLFGQVAQQPGMADNSYARIPLVSPTTTVPSFNAKTDGDKNSTETGIHGQAGHSEMPDGSFSSFSSSTTKVAFPQSDITHDQSVTAIASLTPPPSTGSLSSSVPVTGPLSQYPMQNLSYFPPQSYMHPYPPHYPYAIPLMQTYTGFPLSHPGSQTFSGADAGNSIGGQQHTWGSMNNAYKPMVPFMTYPTVGPNNDQSITHTSQSNLQPPLRATGFIQGEHGTLIPVYHPEALNQYMSTNEHAPTPLPHMPPQGQPVSVWPQYPQFSMYPYPMPMHALAPSPSHQSQVSQQRGWVSSPAPLGLPAPQHAQGHNAPTPYMLPTASSSGSLSSSSSFRGPHTGATYSGVQHYSHRNTPPPKRYNRRDFFHSNFSISRNNVRTSPNRFLRIGPASSTMETHSFPNQAS